MLRAQHAIAFALSHLSFSATCAGDCLLGFGLPAGELEYLDKAISIDPKEFTLLHLRGRFTFEVATLSWIEKKVCNALFSTLPDASIDMALKDFHEADRHVPFVWAENLLYLARCYSIKKDKANAQKYIDMVEAIENKDDMVIESLTEIKALIAKCK
ncbi:Regulator of microtubule dynamics protein 1 [Toxocara canis]|uniref:Regulator of microtubule dynamics protein 1 n=1 Tax=Toxocara canis TaxID=6265 RepID=A0A0B2VKJ4_TOXCA|nr:Regulator of microtubule dynamics protein 1 [Toxocara canis]